MSAIGSRSLCVVSAMVLALAGYLMAAGDVAAEPRVALVVGINNYDHVSDLHKAVNDANAVEEKLRDVGFSIVRPDSNDKDGLDRAIKRFLALLETGGDAVVFFSGHGVQINGANYLLPASIARLVPGQEKKLTESSIGLTALMNSVEGRGVSVGVFIIDACRDNPFSLADLGKGLEKSLGGTKGLAPVKVEQGSFLLFAAAPNQKALDRLADDDPDPNSVFTRILLKYMTAPGVYLHQLAPEYVRREVAALAQSIGRDQNPSYRDELRDVYALNPEEGSPPPVPALPSKPKFESGNAVPSVVTEPLSALTGEWCSQGGRRVKIGLGTLTYLVPRAFGEKPMEVVASGAIAGGVGDFRSGGDWQFTIMKSPTGITVVPTMGGNMGQPAPYARCGAG